MQRKLFLVTLFLACLGHITTSAKSQPRPTSGTITGVVIDEQGRPLDRAKVNAESTDGRPRATAIRFVSTDGYWKFVIDQLSFGEYKVFAQKPEDGYPDQYWSFYGGNHAPRVRVTSEQTTASVVINVGPKAAILIGTVTDKATGEKIANPGFSLRRTDISNGWLSTSAPSDFHILIPPLVRVTVEVSAKGYQPWSYSSPQGYGPSIRLEPGGEFKLDVKLIPLSGATPK